MISDRIRSSTSHEPTTASLGKILNPGLNSVNIRTRSSYLCRGGCSLNFSTTSSVATTTNSSSHCSAAWVRKYLCPSCSPSNTPNTIPVFFIEPILHHAAPRVSRNDPLIDATGDFLYPKL